MKFVQQWWQVLVLALSGLRCHSCFDFAFSINVTVIGFYDFGIHTDDDIACLPFGAPD